jgi:hypothetical protein
MKISLGFLATTSILFIFLSDLILRFNSFVGVSNGSTLLIFLLNTLSILFFILLIFRNPWKNYIPSKALIFIKLYILWCLVSFFHGVFSVDGYFEWKRLLLTYLPSILIPLSIVLVINKDILSSSIGFVSSKLFFLAFLTIPLTISYDPEMFARAVVLITLFILFVPYIEFRWRIFFVAIAVISILINIDYRINILKVLFVLILAVFVYKKLFLRITLLNFALAFSFFLPLILLLLGITDIFNLYRDGLTFDYEYALTITGESTVTQLGSDTRTFLFTDVFNSMISKGSCFIIGEGGGAGYYSNWFVDLAYHKGDIEAASAGRGASEVGFLNQLLYSGIIGVGLYALVLFTAAYYGVNYTSNTLTKLLALFLAFHWIIFFIEDQILFNMNNLAIWLAIGMCLSNSFRSLTDDQISKFLLKPLRIFKWK